MSIDGVSCKLVDLLYVYAPVWGPDGTTLWRANVFFAFEGSRMYCCPTQK